MASTGTNGALGSVSGTIYAPKARSLFDDVSGTGNIALMTACILIDGVELDVRLPSRTASSASG